MKPPPVRRFDRKDSATTTTAAAGDRECRGRRSRLLALAGAALMAACTSGPIDPGMDDGPGRLRARPGAPTMEIAPGRYPLGLGAGRDGLLYVPTGYRPGRPAPLLVFLHGAGGSAAGLEPLFELAEEADAVLLIPDSRGLTWDGIPGRFGPDVAFIDQALAHTFERVAIDPGHLALGGFSDGGSYALSLGVANGDLFSHLMAFSPGFMAPPGRAGRPPIFITHGTQDRVLPIDLTSRRIVPQLEADGYEVTYREFEGPHVVSLSMAREALAWWTGR